MNNKNQIIKPLEKSVHKFDLEERTFNFASNILNFSKNIKINYLTENQVKQLIKSSTSIGANYMEANSCNSKKDFINKISICKKEAKETTYWIRILSIVLLEGLLLLILERVLVSNS